MNPASHLMLVVSQISDLPIKYVRILEELVASGDVEHLLDESDLRFIARALTQSYVQRQADAILADNPDDDVKAKQQSEADKNMSTKALRLRIGSALRQRMMIVLAAEREESQPSYHNEAQFTKLQKFCTTVTLRPIAGADIASGSHESLSDEGTVTTMEHVLNETTLLDAVMGSASIRRVHLQLMNTGKQSQSEAAANIDALIDEERNSLRRMSRKTLLRFRSKMFDVAYEKIAESRLCTHWIIPPSANEQLVTLHAQMVKNITVWFPEQRQRLKHCYELTKYIIDYMEDVNNKVVELTEACETFKSRLEQANDDITAKTKELDQFKEDVKPLEAHVEKLKRRTKKVRLYLTA